MHFEDQRSGFHMSPRKNLPYRRSSDHHLRQVSREAQKLNQMIDSWPTERSFHVRKKEMAADLLRCALGLQESLVTLGKIEEACKFMVRASREQEHGCSFTQEVDLAAEVGMQAMGSRRFDARVHQHALRAARNLRLSRNCVEELKKVIRGSLYRQNLVSIPSDDEKPCPSQSQKASIGHAEHCNQKHGAESSGCAEAAQQKKGRAPNLIARLMGLEEGSPEEFRPVRRTQRGKDSSPRRPLFGPDMPEVGKPSLMKERPDFRREMLQEIKKSTQFKGPGSIERPQIGSAVEGNAGNFPAGDQVPAVVLIRPVHSTSLEMEGMKKSPVEPDQASAHEKFRSPALELAKEMENRAERALVETSKAATSHKTRLPASPHDQKQLKKKASRTNKKTKGTQKAVVDRSTCEEKRKIRSMTASGSEAVVERSTCEEKRKTRYMRASGSEIKENSTPKRPEKNSGKMKNHLLTQRRTSHHEDQDSKKPASRSHIGTARGRRVMRAKPGREPMPIIVKQADTPNCKQESKEISPAQEKGVSPISSSLPPDLLHSGTEHRCIANERGYPVENETEENALKLSSVTADTTKKPSFRCEVLPKCSHKGGNLGPSHEPNRQPSGENRIPVPHESFDHVKSLLLSSPSFLHAQEFFNLHQQPTECRRTETEKKVVEDNSKPLLDSAGELMAYKHYHYELVNHPLWMNCLRTSAIKIHMNWLVHEISREIEELDCRGGAGIAGASGDSLYTRLEEDVKCERVSKNGAWEQGWDEAIPVEEGDRVACDVEKHILQVLVEEIALEFLC